MKIKELVYHPKSKYIVITFVTSAIGFLKSFILLKLFKVEELGVLTLAQTLVTTVSFLQLGVVTGGYRLFSYKRTGVLNGVNSAVLSFFIIMTVVVLSLGIVAGLFYDLDISLSYLLIFLIVAILSLYSNWVICKLLATKNISVVNRAQLWANIITFLLTLSAPWLGFTVVIVSMLILPVLLIFIAYFSVSELIPRYNFTIFKKYIRKIISIGFIPYLTSAMMLLNSQLGRWIITFSLGTAILGRIYLVSLFVTMVNIFPNSVSSLFFPSIIEKFEKKMTVDMRGTLRKYFSVLNIYFILIIIFTLALVDIVVRTFLSKHVESINLIYVILPSLLFLHLSNPAITLFNAAKKFNHILRGSILMVASYCILVTVYLFFFEARLIDFFIIESISAFVFFIYNIYYFVKLNKLH